MASRLMTLLSFLLAAPTYNVGYFLDNSSLRRFNGIGHAFVVTMCRFAYADPPSWLTELQRHHLEQIIGERCTVLVRASVERVCT